MPASGIGGQYFHKDIFEMAAAYLYHIIMNHPFIDGNKRTGACAAHGFLFCNGILLSAEPNEFEAIVRGVAEGRVSKAEAAEFMRRSSQPRTS